MNNLHFIKTTFRSLKRYPLYTGLNVAGLAIGLAVCLAIVLYIRYETTYDEHLTDADRIYRVMMVEGNAAGTMINSMLPNPVVPGLAESFDEVMAGVRVLNDYDELLVEAEGKALYESEIIAADGAFFEFFPAAVLDGSLVGALDDPGSVVISESIAQKYFGRTTVAGLTLSVVYPYQGEVIYTIKAVIEDPARSTHLPYQVVVHRNDPNENRWNYFWGPGYVMLGEQVSAEAFEARLHAWVETNAYYDYPHEDLPALRLQPVTDIHLQPDWGTASAAIGPVQYLRMFGLAAVLVLLIAIINFVNLATARAAIRAKEMGVRKSVGARRSQLMMQLMGEAFTLTFLAFLLALVVMNMLVSVINQQTGIQLTAFEGQAGWLIAVGAGVALVAGLLSGVYPAWYLSAFQPVTTLKGKWIRSASGASLRKGLVVFQFVASIVLVVGTLAIQQQMNYIRTERLNALDQQIVVIKDADRLDGAYNEFKARLLARGAVASVTTSSSVPGTMGSWSTLRQEDGTVIRTAGVTIGDDYLETLGLSLVGGTSFENAPVFPEEEPQTESEDARPPPTPVFVNEAMVSAFQIEDPVGAYVRQFNVRIVGVVEDFHYLSFYEPVDPIRIRYSPDRTFGYAMVRLEEGQIADGLEAIEQAWNEVVPDYPLNYVFLDDQLDTAYRSEMRLINIFGGFALLALLVACLGLFGLVTSMVETRTKEVGIRKVLGASVARIVWLLSRDFMQLVAIAFVIGAPVAYYLLMRWLEQFEYQMTPGLPLFVLGGGLAALLALATVGYQVTLAARSNPVKALRHE